MYSLLILCFDLWHDLLSFRNFRITVFLNKVYDILLRMKIWHTPPTHWVISSLHTIINIKPRSGIPPTNYPSTYSFWAVKACIRKTQPPASIGWVALSSLFVCLFVCPASVTPPLISTIWCFRPYKPYIFCEDMILATCQCHSLLSWAQFTVV